MHAKLSLGKIKRFLETLYQNHGYDFRHYSIETISRRLEAILLKYQFADLAELEGRLLDDKAFLKIVLNELTVTLTRFFRDSSMYQCLSQTVFPELDNREKIRIWHAGCSSGEEVFSLSILLDEAGLYKRSCLYATDINPFILSRAEKGLFSREAIANSAPDYLKASGKKQFQDYFDNSHDTIQIKDHVKENIIFQEQDLAKPISIGTMDLILCRNVLIYFDMTLQEKVLSMISERLLAGSFLCLGRNETLAFTVVAHQYETISHEEHIYRRK